MYKIVDAMFNFQIRQDGLNRQRKVEYIFIVRVCLWMCVGAEGCATINHTMHCNVLKLKKQWLIVHLYSSTRLYKRGGSM